MALQIHPAINREGALAIFFFLGLAGAAIYSGNNGLILLFCWLLAAFTLMIVVAVRNCSAELTMERRFSGEVYAGRDTCIDVVITNHGSRPLYGLHVFERFEDDRFIGPMYIRRLDPGTTVTARYMCLFANRGIAHFTGFQVRSRFPLPFVELRYECAATDTAFIYPEPIPGRDMIRFEEDRTETAAAPRRGRDTAIRELVHGRKAGKILWKLSARRQKWLEAVPMPARPDDDVPAITIVPKSVLGSIPYERQISQITSFVLSQLQHDKRGEILVHNAKHAYGNSPALRRGVLEMLAVA